MKPTDLKQVRDQLGLTQQQLADALQTTRVSIARYEAGMRRIPGMVQVALNRLERPSEIPMAGMVAAGLPIEPIPQSELIDVPPSMLRGGDTFALRVKGESMKEDGILYKVGETSMYLADDGLTITAGGTFWKFSSSGLHQTGGDIGHNKKSIGYLHIHGATPPPSLPFQGDEGSPHTGGPTDAGGGPDPGTGTA